jgi:hypothetical protein
MKLTFRDTFQQRRIDASSRKLILIIALTGAAAGLPSFFAAAQAPNDSSSMRASVSQPTASQQDAQRTAAMILVKNALLAVNQGNLTGNYTVLRDLSSPGFRDRNSAADLAAIFQTVRQQKVDLSALVVVDPVINPPQMNAEGQLVLEGYFMLQQLRFNFQLAFLKANNGGWLIHGVSLNAMPQTAPVAPR